MLCPDCHQEELKFFNGKFTKRCRFCSLKLHRQIANEKRKKDKAELDKKRLMVKFCENCNKEFETVIAKQKFCYNPCSSKKSSIANGNKLWLSQKKLPRKSYLLF